MGDGEAESIPEIPFCNDFATAEDNTETCGNENDCCALMQFEQIRLVRLSSDLGSTT